jgi:two-component system NarL family response regulator
MEPRRRPGVTAREIEVLRLVARGRSNREIGSDLSISEGTVKGHLHRIFHKLGAQDRTQAAVSALRRGLIQL